MDGRGNHVWNLASFKQKRTGGWHFWRYIFRFLKLPDSSRFFVERLKSNRNGTEQKSIYEKQGDYIMANPPNPPNALPPEIMPY